MGLFDNLFDNQTPEAKPLTSSEAFAGILLAASACDGHIAAEEQKSLLNIIRRMKLFDGLTRSRWNDILNRFMKLIQREGAQPTVERCAAVLPSELRATVFANACDIILADGVVEPEEKTFLDHLQTVLSLDQDMALNIVEVMIVKNKG